MTYTERKKNIVVVGIGYVGLSNALLLAQRNTVTLVDINKQKVIDINDKKSPINNDLEINEYLNKTALTATTSLEEASKEADFVIIAVATNFDENSKQFDTTAVENVIYKVTNINKKCTIVIKSTVPIGFTESIKQKLSVKNIIFSPEFLREGKSIYDNLYPSRIILGGDCKYAKEFGKLLTDFSKKSNVQVLLTDYKEAEAIKLFSNAYLAMRVAFFNELDSLAISYKLDTKQIINGVCLDNRIGNFYNNPSFGYGGYCLPKDTKQLITHFNNIPSTLINSITISNDNRKKYIANILISQQPSIVGIYRLTMKSDSDNFRSSAIFDVINILQKNSIKIIIYEPTCHATNINDIPVISEIDLFKNLSDIIVANRGSEILNDVKDKVYCRDIFHRD